MKKYIGLLCGAMLFAVLAAGCSGAYGFDGNNGGSGGGGSTRDPFAGTTWVYEVPNTGGYLYWRLSFKDDSTVKLEQVTYTNTITDNYDGYRVESDDEGYTAVLMKGDSDITSFMISSADAKVGYLGADTNRGYRKK